MSVPVATPELPVTDTPAASVEVGGLDGLLASLTAPDATLPGDPPAPDPVEPVLGETPAGEAEKPAEPAPEPVKPFIRELKIPGRVGPDGQPDVKVKALQLPDQESYDAIGRLSNQAERVPVLEQELQAAQSEAAMLAFLDQHPVEGFTWLAEQKAASAQVWIGQYAKAYPEVVAQFLMEAGYEVKATADPRALAAEAQLAQHALRDATSKARQAHQTTAQSHQAAALGGRAIYEVAQSVGLDPKSPEFKLFGQAAIDVLNSAYPQGNATRDQLILALQPWAIKAAQFLRTQPSTAPVVAALVAPETKPGTPAAPTSTPPANPGAAFDAKSQQAAKFAKLGGGTTPPPTGFLGTPAPANETLEQFTARLTGG